MGGGLPEAAESHGFIKKTRAMPDDDLALARKRLRELEQ